MDNEKNLRLSFNSPVILSFTFLCFIVLGLDFLTASQSTINFFSVYRASLANPLTYLRMVTHVLGHANWGHLFGNMTMLLVVGPLLEEKYGSFNVLLVMLVTAFVTGIVNFVFFPGIRLLGASGVVFAFILLSSFTCTDKKEIPITFILVALIYIGQQIYSAIFIDDNISNLAHLIGGAIGSVFGYIFSSKKTKQDL